jgi:hypothetical protein
MPVTTTATSAQGKRNRRATCECAEAAPAWVGCVLSHSPQRHGDKEKNQALKSNMIRLG